MAHISCALFFLSSSLLLLCPLSLSLPPSVRCVWTKLLADGELHHIFLHQDARLYHSVWSRERALQGCVWSDDASVVSSYGSMCSLQPHDFTLHPDPVLESLLMGPRERCTSLDPLGREALAVVRGSGRAPGPETSQGRDERSEVKRRVKRGFIVPGTLWCGSGNKAPSYSDLGVFSDTDSCCREHDQCKDTILSFHSQFGVFNSNIFTMSHCDCDNRFHRCLTEANDSISDVVGYTFFNLLKMHCFDFSHRLQCTQRNWFGMCKESQMALYADVHPPTLYEAAAPTEGATNTSIINATSPAESPESSTSHPQLLSITAAASTDPTHSTESLSASVAPVSSSPSTVTAGGSGPEREGNDLDSSSNITGQTRTDFETAESCDVYKDLDVCRYKILPQQTRYGINNSELRTLYHCNCTSRLFHTLSKQTRVSDVQSILLGRVSQSCILLPQDCTAGKSCAATLVKAGLPQLLQSSNGVEVEDQRHLEAVVLKVRRPKSSRAQRRDGAVRLHRLCVRMSGVRRHVQRVQQGLGRAGLMV